MYILENLSDRLNSWLLE